MKKLLFVYNPNAGTGTLKSKVSDVVDIFVKAGYEVTIYPTQCYHDTLAKVRSYTEDYELVVCSGGDGTLDETVTAMLERENPVPIGYIPTGTTNDFASSLNIPKKILDAAYVAVNGVPFACDIGQFNEDAFVYVAAFGLFTDVSYATKQEMKNVLGHMAYVLEGTKRIFNIPSYHVKVTTPETVIEDDFILGMVTNSKSVGGFKGVTGKDIVFDDGKFEAMLIKPPKNPLELNEIVASLLRRQFKSKNIYTFKAEKIEFETIQEIPWTLDGEFGGDHDYVRIQNLCKRLEIMVDAKKLPQITEQKKTAEIVK